MKGGESYHLSFSSYSESQGVHESKTAQATAKGNGHNLYPNIEGPLDSGCQQMAVSHSNSQVPHKICEPMNIALQHQVSVSPHIITWTHLVL